MKLSDVKAHTRTQIKTVPGGPAVGTVGSNRAAGVISALDKVAEFAAELSAAQVLTIPNAQQLLLNAPPDDQVKEFVGYAISGDWNSAGVDDTVYLLGIGENKFTATGWVVDNGVVQAVAVDVPAATWALPEYGNDFIRGDAEGNIIVGVTATASGIDGGQFNQISGGEDCHIGAGTYNTIAAGSANQITTGTKNTIVGGEGNTIEGGSKNGVVGGQGNTIPASCTKVLLLNCQQFTPPAGASDVTYIDNQPAGGADLLHGTYTVQAGDVTNPAGAIAITVAGALAFGTVGVAKPGVSGQDILTPNSDYTSQAGQLTIAASLNPPLAVGDEVHYSYLTGSVAAGYTDGQARAAQLGRVAPAGTTTILLTSEAPTDYGTLASGTFTIDAFGCVVGKVVRFGVGAGAGAPFFNNAPTGQPFKYLGASYVSGRPFSYSLLVCVDRIEVITLED